MATIIVYWLGYAPDLDLAACTPFKKHRLALRGHGREMLYLALVLGSGLLRSNLSSFWSRR